MTPNEELQRSIGILAGNSEAVAEDADDLNEEDIGPREKPTFDIAPVESRVPDDTTDDIANDYKHTRNVLYALAKLQGDALALAMEMLRETEHPRAFSTFSEMASSLRETALAINDLQKTYKHVTSGKQSAQPAIGTQNNIIGTPSDIIELLKMAEKQQGTEIKGEVIESD